MKNGRHSISIVVADDHPVVLEGVVSLLSSNSDFNVLAKCRDGNAAVRAITDVRPDVAVLDMAMPGLSGLEVLLKVAVSAPRTKIVFLTAAASDRQVATALARGAKGMLHKDTAPDELVQCVREVAQGRQWLSTTVAEVIAEHQVRALDDVEEDH